MTNAMAFYHQDGLVAAWVHAMKFAGKGGRLATMPDIVAARLATKPEDLPWETYFTTLTAEYFGFSRQGQLILVVAHGVGPMSTLEGIKKAYSWEYKDKSRNHRGGRITQQQFWDLADGKFGEVSTVDLAAYFKQNKYAFCGCRRLSQLLVDPVFKARLGPRAEEYALAHAMHARSWHLRRAGIEPENDVGMSDADHQDFLDRRQQQHLQDGARKADPYIVTVGDPGDCPYLDPADPRMEGRKVVEDGYAFAHLVSTGRLCHLHHEGGESLALDVGCHDWGNGVRFVAIPASSNAECILEGPDARELLRAYWQELLVPVDAPNYQVGFRALVKIREQWFTQYPKKGEGMDTHAPEHLVTAIDEVGEPVQFSTVSYGSMFFKFGIKEVQALAPTGANAYCFVGEPVPDAGNKNHLCMVQFYRVAVDTTERLIQADALAHDFDTMMKLMAKKAKPTS